MDALEALPLEQLVSALKARLESGLNNGQCVWPSLHLVRNCTLTIVCRFHPGFSLSSVRVRDCVPQNSLNSTNCRYSLSRRTSPKQCPLLGQSGIPLHQSTNSPRNSLPPLPPPSMTHSAEPPIAQTYSFSAQRFAVIGETARIWSSVDTTNSRHMKLYLARSKEAPLHVNYGCMTRSGVFEENIIPERHRLLSLSIPLDGATHIYVTRSLLESAESLKTLDMWMTHQQYPISTALMKKVSRFAPNITILRLHDITTGLSSFKFPALIKLTFRVTKPATRNPDAADLIKFLKHSPILEELDLRLPESFKADTSARTVALARLKSAVFSGYSAPSNESVGVNILPYLILPNQSITVDVQTSARAFSSDISPLLSVIQLGGAILPRQSITAATIHIKECPSGFFGHISICGERNNWIGVNHVQVLNRGTSPLSRLRNWLNPLNPAPLYGIQTLTLGLLEFASVEELCVGAFQSFLRGLDQVRVLNVHKMNVSLVARLLEPFDGTLLFPLLEELRFRTFDPPELARSVAHDKGEWNVSMLKGWI